MNDVHGLVNLADTLGSELGKAIHASLTGIAAGRDEIRTMRAEAEEARRAWKRRIFDMRQLAAEHMREALRMEEKMEEEYRMANDAIEAKLDGLMRPASTPRQIGGGV